jgi:serine-type D-Ala-D-Ala endopeptidase (penicillin-binding protein 7)
MPIPFSGTQFQKEVPMRRSRSPKTVIVSVVLMSLGLILPCAVTAEAAASASPSQQTTTTRVTSSATQKTTVRRTSKRYSSTRASARRMRLARAKAAAYARDARALQTPKYRTDANGLQIPDVRAEAAIIYNPVTHEILYEANSTSPRSIASITKVMTAVVFLEHASSVGYEIEVQPADVRAASTTYLRAYERVTPDTLLNFLLIGSDNAAARVLARSSPFGAQGFVDRMNDKAKELGLENTHYADPSGLDPANVSSAYDMARLIAFAGNDERIASIMRKSEETLTTSRRTVTVHNTNKLVGGDVNVRGGKTGFIRQAGYCLATLLQLPQGDPVAVVVLGARSNAGRFMETKHLFNWLAERTTSLLKTDAAKSPEPQP